MFIIIYVTYPDEECALRISDVLVNAKLVACSNILPIKSMYWWDNKIQSEGEWVSLLKSIPKNWDNIKNRIEEIHPYEVPCIMKMKVEANEAYEDWIKKQCLNE